METSKEIVISYFQVYQYTGILISVIYFQHFQEAFPSRGMRRTKSIKDNNFLNIVPHSN